MLKPLYTAETEEHAKAALEELDEKYSASYPSVARTFRNGWQQFVPFLAYPSDVRRMLYTTNTIDSLNSQLRNALGNRGPFPTTMPSSSCYSWRFATRSCIGRPTVTGIVHLLKG
jgi:transposase-like protein